MNNEDRYYLRYEDRYQRVQAQGYRYWNPFPDLAAETLSSIDEFLEYAGCTPGAASVIEFGCGEGFIGEHLLGKEYDYCGLDISPSAIRNARERVGSSGAPSFRLTDVVTGLDEYPSGVFHAAIDNQCLHMLVTDDHRSRYLTQVKRLLKREGKVFFHLNYRADEFTETIVDYADWLEKFGDDYSSLRDYDMIEGNEKRTVQLPRLPARANNESGYRKELGKAGLSVEYFVSDGWQCIIYAGNPDENGVAK